MDLVSIIIPYFKKKEFVKNSIFSVLNQTYPNLEIIIIYDDTDKSDLTFLKKEFYIYKKIKFLINSKNIGAGISRNKGIRLAKGKYICFLDADDYWNKNKIEKQLKFMKKKKLKISHTSYKIVNEKKKYISSRIARDFFKLSDIIKSCDIGLSTVMIEKKILTKKIKFPPLKTKEDFVLWINLLKKGYTIGGLNLFLTSWRKSRYSLSSSTIQKLFDGFKVYKYYLKFSTLKSLVYLLYLSINYLKKNG